MKKLWLMLIITLILMSFLISCQDSSGTSAVMTTTEKAPTTTDEVPLQGVLPTEIMLSNESLTLYSGTSYQINARVLPDHADRKTVTYSSSDNKVVSVSQDGMITAHSKGDATVTASTVNGKTDTVNLTVIDEKTEGYYFYSTFSADTLNPEIMITNSSGGAYTLDGNELSLTTEGSDFINGKIYFSDGIDGYIVAQASLKVETNAFSNLFYFYSADDTTNGVVCSVAAENGQFKYHNGNGWVDLERCYLGEYYEITLILRIGDRTKNPDKGCFDITINERTYRDLPLRKGGDGVEDSIRYFFFGSNKQDTSFVYDYLYLMQAKVPFVYATENHAVVDLETAPSYQLSYELSGYPQPEIRVTCDKEEGWTLTGEKLTFTKPGIYDFIVTASNQYGSDSDTVTVTVNATSAAPELSIKEENKVLLLSDNTQYTLQYYTYAGVPEARKTITCNQNDGFSLNGDIVTFTREGDYIFTVKLENSIGVVQKTITVHVVTERVVWNEDFGDMPLGTKKTETGSGHVSFENGVYHVTTGSGSCQAFADIPLPEKLSESYTVTIDFTVNTNAFSNILFMLADGTSPASNGGICIAVENGTLKYHNGSIWMGIKNIALGERHTLMTVFDWNTQKQEIILDGVSLGVYAVRNGNNAKNTTHLYLGSDKSNTDFTIDSIKIVYSGFGE